MSFEVSWYISERIINVHVLGELGLADIESLSNRIAECLQEGVAPVHVLLDDAKGGQPPLSLKQLKARLGIVNHPTIGWIVGIGEVDAVAKFLIPLVMKIVSLKYTRFATLEEALKFLAKQDATLTIEV